MKCYWCLNESYDYLFACPSCGRYFKGPEYKGTYCPNCGQTILRRICENCKKEVTVTTDDVIGIALVGGKEVGKSHYLVSLFENIRKELSKRGIYIQFKNEKYWKDLKNYLENQKTILPVTSTSGLRNTLVCEIGFLNSTKPVVLSIRDVAGEDIENINDNAKLDRILSNILKADAIIFLIDIFQMSEFRGKEGIKKVLESLDVQLPSGFSDPDVILSKIIEFLIRGRQANDNPLIKIWNRLLQQSNGKIDKPIAVVLSKLDLIFEVFDRISPGMLSNSPLRATETNHLKNGSFVCLNEMSVVNNDVKTLLGELGLTNLINLIETKFSSSHFFGVSSLGHPPDKHGRIEIWQPHRVEEPLWWTLYKLGKFKGSWEC